MICDGIALFLFGLCIGFLATALFFLWTEKTYPAGWIEVRRCPACDGPMSYDYQNHPALPRPRDCSGTGVRLCPHCGTRFDIFAQAGVLPAVGRFRWLRWEWKEPKGSVQQTGEQK